MILHTRQDLVILKLTNSEDFGYAQCYDHDGDWYEFEGYLLDEDQVKGYHGEPYGPDNYFHLHSTFQPGSTFDYRGSDESVCESHPWIMIISGDNTLYCAFKRFRTFADISSWLDNPTYDELFYVF